MKNLIKVLKMYETFEANLVMDESSWRSPTGHPFATDALYDEFMECQKARNKSIKQAMDFQKNSI